ncbi:MAG: hypothetical protein N2039_01030, partial [Gemmataceae bacterium]|nr:hypothetical protein [Gemmataceae bacterium]
RQRQMCIRDSRYAHRMEFGPDGKTLMEIGLSYTPAGAVQPNVVVWDVDTGKVKNITQASIDTNMIHISVPTPDHRRIIAPSGSEICVIDLAEGKEVQRLRDAAHLPFSTFMCRPGGRELVQIIGPGEGVVIWDLEQGKPIRQFGKTDHVGSRGLLMNASLSPDGRWLAFGDGLTAQLLDLATGERRGGVGHRTALLSAYFAPDGQSILTRSQEAYCQWDATTGAPLRTFRLDPPHTSFLLTRDMKWLVASNPNMTLHVIDAATMKEKHAIPLNVNHSFTYSCAPDSRSVIVLGQQVPLMQVYDLVAGEKTWEFSIPTSSNPTYQASAPLPRRISVSRDARLVAGSIESVVMVWDIITRRVVQRLELTPGQVLRQMSFSPDNRLLAMEFYDGEISLWELASGTRRLYLEKPKERSEELNLPAMAQGQLDGTRLPSALAFSLDGRLVANGTVTGSIRIYDAWTGHRTGTLEGHRRSVTSLSFSPDGKRLVSAGADASALVWDVTPFSNESQRPEQPRVPEQAQVPQQSSLPEQPKLPEPSAAGSIEDPWAALAELDAAKAHAVAQALVAQPRRAIDLLRGKLQPAADDDEQVFVKLLADLESPRYAVRQRAKQELERLGEAALPALRKALEQPNAETRSVARRLLDALSIRKLTLDQIRQIRAVEILEKSRHPDAVALLRELAKGGPSAPLTQEACRALERIHEAP